MCGRYASTRSAADLAALFDALDETGADDLLPDYNVAPTDPVPIVRRSSRTPGPVLSVARWGLVPGRAPDLRGAARMINARVETVATSPAFARPFAHRRCLVPADGWYEWRRIDGRKQPYFMTRRDGDCLAFAGIWTPSQVQGARMLTFSILTLAAHGELALVHDRMPLILPPAAWTPWLTAADATALLAVPADATSLLAVPPDGYLAGIELRPVSVAVGDVRNDGPDLIRAVPASSTVEPTGLTLF